MRIIQVIQSLKIGGAEKVCLDLACQLTERGHDVKIVILQDRVEIDLTAYSCRFNIQPLLPGRAPIWIKNLIPLAIAFRRLDVQDWDIVHCHMDGALAIATLGGAMHTCYTIHNSAHGHWNGFGLHRIRAGMEWLFARRTDVTIVGCGPGATNWSQMHLGGPNKVVYNIPNGIDITKFPYRVGKWSAHTPVRILMVGKLSQQKNHAMAIRAIAEFQRMGYEVELRIAGEGSLQPKLLDLGLDLNVVSRVKFLGQQCDILQLYHDNDIFWMTSEHEGLPLTLLEAMASGIPCIVTNAPGIREVATVPRIPIVEINDVASLVQETRFLIENPTTTDINCRESLDLIKREFTALRMMNDYMKLFEHMVS